MKKLNVGLVGAGFMGKAHSIGYSDMPKYFWPAPAVPVLKTICDIVPEIAADAKERFGFEKCCTDWRDIVNDPEIDVVSICTPNNVHAEIAIAALNAGKHVLCEKPIASTLEDAKAMAEAAKKAAQKGIIAMNAYQYRRVPAIDLAKKFIDEGSIGKILNVRCTYLQSWSADPASPLSWRFQKDIAGAGTLGDIASHVIDIAQYLAGDIEAVTGMMQTYITERPVQEGGTDLLGTVKLGADAKRKAVDVDDEDSFLVKFKNGAVGSIEATRNAWGRNNFITVELHGTLGSLYFNYERLNELQVCLAGDRPRAFSRGSDLEHSRNEHRVRRIEIHRILRVYQSGGRRQTAVYQLRRRVSSGTRLRCRETVGGNRTLGNGERLMEAPV